MFDKIKQLQQLRQRSQKIQKELEEDVYEVNHKGYQIRVRGDLQVQAIVKEGQYLDELKDGLNKAFKEAQKGAAKKMRGRLGDFNLPGL